MYGILRVRVRLVLGRFFLIIRVSIFKRRDKAFVGIYVRLNCDTSHKGVLKPTFQNFICHFISTGSGIICRLIAACLRQLLFYTSAYPKWILSFLQICSEKFVKIHYRQSQAEIQIFITIHLFTNTNAIQYTMWTSLESVQS